MGCIYTILDILFIRAMVWLFWFAIDTYKYMAMAFVSVFVGPATTIKRLARSNTSRITGIPADKVEEVCPDLFKVERTKVIAWMVWAYIYWLFVIIGSTAAWLGSEGILPFAS